jgi:branched-chain amino acid transport system permease protein
VTPQRAWAVLKMPRAAWAAAAAAGAAWILPGLRLPQYDVSLLTQTWIFGIAAMSLDLLVGFTGLVSFSQAAFFGTSAYVVAILQTQYHVAGFWPSLGLGLAAAGALSAVFGVLALRAEGVGFIILTLALNEIIWGLAYQWVSVSGGDNGITGLVRPPVAGIALTGNDAFYRFCLLVLAVCAVLLALIVRSPFGLVLQGLRERPRRMAALGVPVQRFRYAAFIIAALFTGLAGVLFAYYNAFVGPVNLSLETAVQILIMVILGGRGTLLGPVAGAAVVVFVSNALSSLTQRWELILGAIYVAILLWARDGIAGIGRRVWRAAAACRPGQARARAAGPRERKATP